MESFTSTVKSQVFYLDGFDAKGTTMSISICYWYENSARSSLDAFMPPRILERAFYKTLEEFPVIAGHLKADASSRMYIDVDKDNLNMPVYTDTCCEVEYSTVRESGFNIHKLPIDMGSKCGVPVPSGLVGGRIVPAHFRVVRFKDNSGVLVYSRITHYITDGYGYTQFMNRWAEVSRWIQQSQDANAAPLPERQYIHDRAFHADYRTKQTTALEPKVIDSLTTRTMFSRWLGWVAPETRARIYKAMSGSTDTTCSYFHVSAKQMEDIRTSVQKHAPEGIRYSMNDVFTAYLTIVVGQAMEKVSTDWWSKPIPAAIRAIFGNSLGKPVDFVTGSSVNIRTRLSHPDANIFMGNMATRKSIVVPPEQFQTEPTAEALSTIALRIHQAISAFDEQYAGQLGYLLDKEPDSYVWRMFNSIKSRNVIGVSNQFRFAHYDVDFGAGIPSIVRHVPYPSTNNLFIMPANPTIGGYELEFNLPPAVEANLVQNNAWMKLVDKYDSYP
ncbi:hypothetical protein LPJ59_000158 [Coemansia sp. RSA 2399]|nr:hypothetical protein LPJ59_000158 [Coemansia sp. RSA 2399]KAJ1908189.1 hypothetical protein LPJ81_000265 [Coemansia sp. IMI 209127]